MEMKQFAEAVLTALREKADGRFNAWIIEKEKNNGVILTGITTESPGCNVRPCIYLDDYYEIFRNGDLNPSEAADMVYDRIMEHQKYIPDISIQDFLQWDSVRGLIYPKLVNTELNRNQLEQMPNRSFLDLSVVYYVKIAEDENGIRTIAVRNEHLILWRQDEGAIYEAALKNMAGSGTCLFGDMLTVLSQRINLKMTQTVMDSHKMYILTNHRGCFGAAEILEPSVAEKISQQIGDFIVLPSSVHELFIIPEEHTTDSYSHLAAIVRCVNRESVSLEERLSDHVYTYHRQDGALRMAA